MKTEFNSGKCILIAVILNFVLTNILHNKSKLDWKGISCGLVVPEKFDNLDSIKDIIINLILFQRGALYSSTTLLFFIVGLSVFLISGDYYKTLKSILIAVIINTIGIHIIFKILLQSDPYIIFNRIANFGCFYDLIEDGDLNYNKLFYYHSLMPISSAIFTYLIVSLCI